MNLYEFKVKIDTGADVFTRMLYVYGYTYNEAVDAIRKAYSAYDEFVEIKSWNIITPQAGLILGKFVKLATN